MREYGFANASPILLCRTALSEGENETAGAIGVWRENVICWGVFRYYSHIITQFIPSIEISSLNLGIMVVESAAEDPPSLRSILEKAGASALRGGTAGAVAMGANVGLLMWMRTTVNYQYRHGTNFPTALRTLYADGGIPRFYRGVLPALVQGPLSRFGDTAANTGMLTLLDSFPMTKDLPLGAKTVACSMSAGLFRIFLMPVVRVCKYTRLWQFCSLSHSLLQL